MSLLHNEEYVTADMIPLPFLSPRDHCRLTEALASPSGNYARTTSLRLKTASEIA
jgi:hypothetical protein